MFERALFTGKEGIGAVRPSLAVLVWRAGSVARFGTPVAQPALGGFGTMGMSCAGRIFGIPDGVLH